MKATHTTDARINQLIIKGAIADLTPIEREACDELAQHVRRFIERAGKPVGELALMLVASEVVINNE